MTPAELAEGRERLQAWLPEARQRAPEMEAEPQSGLALAIRPHLVESNFDALVIRPGEKGGWIADLVLKQVPLGIPNTIGTPVTLPFATREAAEEHGRQILAFALAVGAETDAAVPEPPPVFLLHGYRIPLNPVALAEMVADLGPTSAESEPLAAKLLQLEIERHCPAGSNVIEAFRAMSDEALGELMFALHTAALHGILAYPLRTPAAPQPPGGPH